MKSYPHNPPHDSGGATQLDLGKPTSSEGIQLLADTERMENPSRRFTQLRFSVPQNEPAVALDNENVMCSGNKRQLSEYVQSSDPKLKDAFREGSSETKWPEVETNSDSRNTKSFSKHFKLEERLKAYPDTPPHDESMGFQKQGKGMMRIRNHPHRFVGSETSPTSDRDYLLQVTRHGAKRHKHVDLTDSHSQKVRSDTHSTNVQSQDYAAQNILNPHSVQNSHDKINVMRDGKMRKVKEMSFHADDRNPLEFDLTLDQFRELGHIPFRQKRHKDRLGENISGKIQSIKFQVSEYSYAETIHGSHHENHNITRPLSEGVLLSSGNVSRGQGDFQELKPEQEQRNRNKTIETDHREITTITAIPMRHLFEEKISKSSVSGNSVESFHDRVMASSSKTVKRKETRKSSKFNLGKGTSDKHFDPLIRSKFHLNRQNKHGNKISRSTDIFGNSSHFKIHPKILNMDQARPTTHSADSDSNETILNLSKSQTAVERDANSQRPPHVRNLQNDSPDSFFSNSNSNVPPSPRNYAAPFPLWRRHLGDLDAERPPPWRRRHLWRMHPPPVPTPRKRPPPPHASHRSKPSMFVLSEATKPLLTDYMCTICTILQKRACVVLFQTTCGTYQGRP